MERKGIEEYAQTTLNLYRAYRKLKEGAKSVTVAGGTYRTLHDICRVPMRLVERVEARTGWKDVWDDSKNEGVKGEYRILLPNRYSVVYLTGALDGDGETQGEVHITVRDQPGAGTHEYGPKTVSEPDWEKALVWFADCVFYSGGWE